MTTQEIFKRQRELIDEMKRIERRGGKAQVALGIVVAAGALIVGLILG